MTDREKVDLAVGRARDRLDSWRCRLSGLGWSRSLSAVIRDSDPDPLDVGAQLALRALAVAAPHCIRLRESGMPPGELAALLVAGEVCASSVRMRPGVDGVELSRALRWTGPWADTLAAAALGSVGAVKGLGADAVAAVAAATEISPGGGDDGEGA